MSRTTSSEGESSEPVRVVIAEDEAIIRLDLKETLEDEGYQVSTESSTRKLFKQRRTFRARSVVFAAGALGTVNLLLQCRERGSLPRLSPALGSYVRTNSEIICGATARSDKVDYSRGIAIASGFHSDPDTYIEVVRYPKGSDVMSFLGTLLVDGGSLLQP